MNSLKALSRLEDLSLDWIVLYEGYGKELLAWTFPRLVHCVVSPSQTWNSRAGPKDTDDLLASFLLRHPALKSFRIPDKSTLLAPARIPLPHLQVLECPAEVIPSIITHGLRQAIIYWPTRLDVETIVVAVKSMARGDMPFVFCNKYCDEDFPEIVDSISRNIPHTRALQLRLQWKDTEVGSLP
jgi:hypothetical protein